MVAEEIKRVNGDAGLGSVLCKPTNSSGFHSVGKDFE